MSELYAAESGTGASDEQGGPARDLRPSETLDDHSVEPLEPDSPHETLLESQDAWNGAEGDTDAPVEPDAPDRGVDDRPGSGEGGKEPDESDPVEPGEATSLSRPDEADVDESPEPQEPQEPQEPEGSEEPEEPEEPEGSEEPEEPEEPEGSEEPEEPEEPEGSEEPEEPEEPEGSEEPEEPEEPEESADQMAETISHLDERKLTTDSGEAFYGLDDAGMRDMAEKLEPEQGAFTVDLHGTPNSVEVDGRTLSAEELGAFLASDKSDWDGGPVRLMSCETGQGEGSFAQQLSEVLGVPVTAPTELAWSDSQGNSWVASGYLDEYGDLQSTWPPDGEWITFDSSNEK